MVVQGVRREQGRSEGRQQGAEVKCACRWMRVQCLTCPESPSSSTSTTCSGPTTTRPMSAWGSVSPASDAVTVPVNVHGIISVTNWNCTCNCTCTFYIFVFIQIPVKIFEHLPTSEVIQVYELAVQVNSHMLLNFKFKTLLLTQTAPPTQAYFLGKQCLLNTKH